MKTNRGSRICITQDGHKYLVQQLDFTSRLVYCWGEVVSYQGLKTKHGTSKRFKLDEVKVEEVVVTPLLVEELFQQSVKKIEENGDLVRSHSRTGNKLKTVIAKPGASQKL